MSFAHKPTRDARRETRVLDVRASRQTPGACFILDTR